MVALYGNQPIYWNILGYYLTKNVNMEYVSILLEYIGI